MSTATDLDVAVELRLAAGRLSRRLRVLAASGLTASQSSMLACLAGGGPMTLGELATREGISAPTASRAVDHLEAIGLVQRQADPNDGRRHSIVLTEEGQRTRANSDDEATVVLAAALARRSGADRRAVEQALPVLRAVVADLCAPSKV